MRDKSTQADIHQSAKLHTFIIYVLGEFSDTVVLFNETK